MAIAWLKMEDVSIFAKWLKFFDQKKKNQDKKMKAFWFFEAPNDISTIM
jgi:hypothetical protein